MTDELASLRRRVEDWRDGGGRGSRIPEELWEAAVGVARTVGVSATARALRFGYQKLKVRTAEVARTGGTGRRRRRVGSRRPEFVALPMPALPEAARVVVAFVAPDGEQMRMEVSGASAMDMVALARAFWGRRT